MKIDRRCDFLTNKFFPKMVKRDFPKNFSQSVFFPKELLAYLTLPSPDFLGTMHSGKCVREKCICENLVRKKLLASLWPPWAEIMDFTFHQSLEILNSISTFYLLCLYFLSVNHDWLLILRFFNLQLCGERLEEPLSWLRWRITQRIKGWK